jgi:hypothetical protein
MRSPLHSAALEILLRPVRACARPPLIIACCADKRRGRILLALREALAYPADLADALGAPRVAVVAVAVDRTRVDADELGCC